ncbi:MAG: VF530 family DNA-binding protein [Oceanospirillaceae bacterium]|nr:VF530 family DNA-binding protein [Oceanospirillaceae bacterium]
MTDEIKYKNNPLNGVSLKKLINELVDHYGFEILFAYLNINCFKTNPSVDSSIKFLKKTEWAREKVEVFYMYEFKNYPRASSEQFQLPPRDRIVPDNQVAGEPATLSLEDAERLREKRAKKAAERTHGAGFRKGPGKRFATKKGGYSRDADEDQHSPHGSNSSADNDVDPWAKWKK